MPLHMTKIAFECESAADFRDWLESHAGEGEAHLTPRYLPKRQAEMTGGSPYWILNHRIIGRSPLLGFTDAPGGRIWIRLEPRLISVRSQVRRAHQGWRRSDERRVGKECVSTCRSRWAPDHKKKKKDKQSDKSERNTIH